MKKGKFLRYYNFTINNTNLNVLEFHGMIQINKRRQRLSVKEHYIYVPPKNSSKLD